MSRNDSKKKELKEKLENEFEELVKKYLPLSSSMNNLCSYLGLRGVEGYYNKIRKIISKYNLSTEHFDSYSQNYEKFLKRKIGKNGKFLPMTDEEFFQSGHNRASDSIIKRLIKGKHKEYKCENCGISKWNGKELRLQVHHINGDHSDNRVENLQLLCPNCHTQTDTYARQNAFKTKGFKITKRLKECLNGEENSFNELNADT